MSPVRINSRRGDAFKHLPRTDPNLSIEPLGHSTATTKLRFSSSIPRSPPSRGSGRFSVSSQTCSLLEEEKEEEEAKSVSARGRQARTRWGLDPARLFLHSTRRSTWRRSWTSIFARSSSSLKRIPPPWFIFRFLEEFYPRSREKNSTFMYFLVARLLLSVSLSRFLFLSFSREGKERRNRWARNCIYFFLVIGSFYFVILFRSEEFFFYTYRLLIDEVENNVKILKLISELSERYKISDGKFPMGSNLIKWATFRRISFIRRMWIISIGIRLYR